VQFDKLHGTQYTPQLETLFTTTWLNIQRRIFTDYLQKIVISAKLHGTKYTPQLETLFTTTLLNI
jgi:hypothetical protein